MRLEARLAKLETVRAVAAMVDGIGYEADGARWVCTNGAILTWEEWQARHAEGRVIKWIIGISPHDI